MVEDYSGSFRVELQKEMNRLLHALHDEISRAEVRERAAEQRAREAESRASMVEQELDRIQASWPWRVAMALRLVRLPSRGKT